MGKKPLEGIRVLELGQLMAGPFAGTLLGYFGAEVVKVEAPGKGDAVRGWRVVDETGTAAWWYTLGRNKKCITLDLRQEEGRGLARRLADQVDVVIENFRPGTMERWGLGPDELKTTNPGLVYSRISGYGQDGPYASLPGYASVCEGVGGFRYVTGFPGGPPVRPNLSLGDSLAALHAAFGVVLALFHRDRGPRPGQAGQVVDTAIYEAVFNMMEAVVPEFDLCGVVREPSGSTITGIVPTNTYPCRDGRWVIIGGNGDSIFKRLMRAAGRPEMADDSRLAENAGRVAHQDEVDGALAEWTSGLTVEQVLEALEEARVPAGPIYSVADMMNDPHFQARGLFEEVEAAGRRIKIPAILPRLTETPGGTEWAGPPVGAHNREVLGGWLGLSSGEIEALGERGVIGPVGPEAPAPADAPPAADDQILTGYRSKGLAGEMGFGEAPAVLVVDMILGFTDPSSPLGSDLDAEIEATRRLLEAARVRGVPIFFTTTAYSEGLRDAGLFVRKIPSLSVLREGAGATLIDPRLGRRDGETLVAKKYASAFFGTALASELTALGVDTLVVCGATTSGCIRATVVDAMQHGFRPIVPEECVGDRSAEAHRANLVDIEGKYGDVLGLDEVLDELEAVAYFAGIEASDDGDDE